MLICYVPGIQSGGRDPCRVTKNRRVPQNLERKEKLLLFEKKWKKVKTLKYFVLNTLNYIISQSGDGYLLLLILPLRLLPPPPPPPSSSTSFLLTGYNIFCWSVAMVIMVKIEVTKGKYANTRMLQHLID